MRGDGSFGSLRARRARHLADEQDGLGTTDLAALDAAIDVLDAMAGAAPGRPRRASEPEPASAPAPDADLEEALP